MKNANVKNQAQANQEDYFNGVLYTRVRINEVKLITPKKGDRYCAVNATILSFDGDKKIYTNIDLIVKGQKVKQLFWEFNDLWPSFDKKSYWLADINIGSISHIGFEKRNGEAGATLKGRLINIRSLKIGNDVVFGEMNQETANPAFVSPAYINLVDNKKGLAKASLLEGKIGEHGYQNISLFYKDKAIAAFKKLEVQGLCPRGYQHRDTNAKLFATLEIAKLEAIGYKDKKDGSAKSYLSGQLVNVRYLKANDKVLTQSEAKEAVA